MSRYDEDRITNLSSNPDLDDLIGQRLVACNSRFGREGRARASRVREGSRTA